MTIDDYCIYDDHHQIPINRSLPSALIPTLIHHDPNSIDDDVCNPSPTIINPYCYCCCKNGHQAISREPRVVS